MNRRAEGVRNRRQHAWARGRELRDGLLARYCKEYGVAIAPPPARIIDELLVDFLGVDLRYDPLNENVFAQTEWIDGRPVVTVNSLTGSIPGVGDEIGVQNVGKWHEAIHIVRDLDVIRSGASVALPGFEAPPKIVCFRSGGPRLTGEAIAREFWAEESGRAAAVSHSALSRSEAFVELCHLASRASGPIKQGWPLLYQAAQEIGVNITALVKQLRLEGFMGVAEEAGQGIYVQPGFSELMEVG